MSGEIERLKGERSTQEQEWAALCAERERPLRAEIERLKGEIGEWERSAATGMLLINRQQTEIESLTADLHATLQAVLYHFGPEGAHKVTTSVLAKRTPAGADTGGAVGVGPPPWKNDPK